MLIPCPVVSTNTQGLWGRAGSLLTPFPWTRLCSLHPEKSPVPKQESYPSLALKGVGSRVMVGTVLCVWRLSGQGRRRGQGACMPGQGMGVARSEAQ